MHTRTRTHARTHKIKYKKTYDIVCDIHIRQVKKPN